MKLALCWLWVILVTIGLCFSIYFIALGYDETREKKVKEYEEGVETWNEAVRPQFIELDIKVYETADRIMTNETLFSNVLKPVDREVSTITEKLDHDGYGELPDYEPLYFISWDPSSVFNLETEHSLNMTKTISLNLLVNHNDTEWTIPIPP